MVVNKHIGYPLPTEMFQNETTAGNYWVYTPSKYFDFHSSHMKSNARTADAAIKNAIRNLLITNFYERPFQDDLGANLRGLLFEPAGVLTNIEQIFNQII